MAGTIIILKLLLLIHLCLSQDDLSQKFTTLGSPSCIQFQTFILGQSTVSVAINNTALCSSVLINGIPTTLITESYKDRINCTIDRINKSVKFCFNSIRISDAGVYSIIKVGPNPETLNGTVYVMDKPTLPIISPTSAEELQQIILNCTSSSTSEPSPTGLAMVYNWTVNGTAPEDQRYSVSNNMLTIHTVQRGDKDRIFRCVATEYNGLSSDRTDVMLNVTYRPIVFTSSNVTTVEGTRGQLSCNVLDANPPTIQRYNWYKDTNPTAILTTNRTLTLASTNRQDYGVYSCKAENSVGMSIMPASAAVIVQFGPDSVTVSGNTTLNEDTTLTLRCNAALSNPQSTLSWYKNGAVVTLNSQVTTTDGMYGGMTSHQVYSTVVRKQDHRANITCVANNTAGTSFGFVILNIRYKPVAEVQPSNQVVIEGNQNIVFRCVVTDTNPSPVSYSWRKGGSSTIGVNQNYTIQNVRRSDDGSYSCTSTNIAGTSEQAKGTLEVLYPPEIADIANQTSEEGTTLSMTCTITTSNPAPNRIYWTRSKDPTYRQNSSVLTIPNISRGHTDTYTCHAENTMTPSSGSTVVGSNQKEVMVDVLYGPGNSVGFDSVSSTISMEENNTRSIPTIRCLADCNPPCQYSWTGNTGSSTATLNLGTATRDKNGTYTCKASNNISGSKRENEKELIVKIFYHARITSFEIQSGSIHDEHSNVSLICTVDSYPVSNVTWTSTGDIQQTSHQANPSSTLILRNVTCHDTANYTCSAYNGYGSNSMETKTLYVRCTPRLPLTEKEQVEVGVGDGENLTISSTFMAYPEPSVTWYFKAASTNRSQNISKPPVEQIGLNIFNSTLVRVLQDRNDFGEYRSVAVNSAGNGTAQQIYIVAANRQPSKPRNLSVVCHASTTANVSWTSGFNGGLQQCFNIMYRPSTTNTYTSSSNISDNGKEHRYYILFNLRPATQYFIKVKSTNSLGSVFATEEINCETKGFEGKGGSSSAVIGGVAGTSAAILLIVIVIVGIFFFRRIQSKTHGDGKEPSERPLALMNEVPDGIKDNILYESAGDNFNQPRQDVYAEVVKPKIKGAAVRTNDVYAEVQKPKKSSNKKKLKGNDNKLMADVYENVGEIKGASKEPEGRPAERGYRNEDGLLYVDVDIKPSTDGRRNVIIGEEERTDYASVDFVVPQ